MKKLLSITLEQFKKGKIAINTKTQEEYDSLMRFFDSKDTRWGSGNKATDWSCFEYNEEETCIDYKYKSKIVSYSNKNNYTSKGYKIILPIELKEYNEFIGNVKFAKDVKVGDLVFEKDGKYHKAKTPETQYLTIGQAIDYMLESEDNVITVLIIDLQYDHQRNMRIKNGVIETFKDKEWVSAVSDFNFIIKEFKNIRKLKEK